MCTKGYMEHMKKVNKGLEYMYPNRGKGINRKNITRNPTNTQNKGIAKKAEIKVELRGLKFPASQHFIAHSQKNIRNNLENGWKCLDIPLTSWYIGYVEWLRR